MEKIKIKKIDSLSVFKASFIICGIGGFLLGLVLAIFSVPWRTTTSLNGDVINSYVTTTNGYVSSVFGIIIAMVINFILIALFITLMSIAFNFVNKLFGGLTIYIEREEK